MICNSIHLLSQNHLSSRRHTKGFYQLNQPDKTHISIDQRLRQHSQISLKYIQLLFMQIENQGALLAFSRAGHPHDAQLPYQPQLIYSQTLLGSLFVRSYRLLRKDKSAHTLVFLKRVAMRTQYLFLKLLDSPAQIKNEWVSEIQKAVEGIRRLKQIGPTEPFDYKVMIGYLNQRRSFELNSMAFEAESSRPAFMDQRMEQANQDKSVSEESSSLIEIGQGQEGCLNVVGGSELQVIKSIVWSYLDTFGARHKDNFYYDCQRRGNQHLDLGRIIDTVNWILYTETVNTPYNQLESSNWTCFEAQAKQKCKSDRKEIVLTGSGRILFIPLLFICEKLENYRRQCERELREVMEESKKHYLEGEVKAYLITDQIDEHGLLYKTKSATLQRFSFLV